MFETSMKRIPAMDLSRCTDCESCLALCPQMFRRNDQTGLIEVVDLPEYAEEEVQAAISICPADCISWETS
jgi:ferredoxin